MVPIRSRAPPLSRRTHYLILLPRALLLEGWTKSFWSRSHCLAAAERKKKSRLSKERKKERKNERMREKERDQCRTRADLQGDYLRDSSLCGGRKEGKKRTIFLAGEKKGEENFYYKCFSFSSLLFFLPLLNWLLLSSSLTFVVVVVSVLLLLLLLLLSWSCSIQREIQLQ